ncbi:unnamed protein product [Ixodes persulcatus]
MVNFSSIVLSVTCVKLLFITAYRSTDFEVHRNWLAITHSLPTSKWYFESTSEWTLDYPPLFAWFEYFLSLVARFVDPAMLQLNNLNYASTATVYFQRLSVIFSDLVFIYAVWTWRGLVAPPKKRHGSASGADPWFEPATVLAMLFLWNPGLLLVDHIHFQYNGFLHGILLLAAARLFQGRAVEAAFWFAVLLYLKHIYIYVAPVFFVCLLRSHCFGPTSEKGMKAFFGSFRPVRFLQLAGTVILVSLVSLWPFLSQTQFVQLGQRLFPFKRGLCHAYWAPNWWALYAAMDRVMALSGLMPKSTAEVGVSTTAGLVRDSSFVFLPDVRPVCTFILTLLFQLPALWGLWKRPQDPWALLRAFVLCSLSAFLFGWHVHEKAVLMPILLATPLALRSSEDAAIFVLLSFAGHCSLFPLLFQPAETPIKGLLVLLHTVYAICALRKLHGNGRDTVRRSGKVQRCEDLLAPAEQLGISVLALVLVYSELIHPFVPSAKRLQFLPLLLTSVSCAACIIYAWIRSWVVWVYPLHP